MPIQFTDKNGRIVVLRAERIEDTQFLYTGPSGEEILLHLLSHVPSSEFARLPEPIKEGKR